MMFRRIGAVAVVAAGALLFSDGSGAHKLNPLMDRAEGGKGRFFTFSDTVHEDITYAALACLDRTPAEGREIADCDLQVSRRQDGDPGNLYNALIRGVWWNDDPNQLLNSIHYLTWVAWMKDAESIATTGRNLRGQRRTINSTYKMLYRSHYGDLQFLHSMAPRDGVSAEATRDEVIGWMRFAYQVAIEEIDPQTRLEEIDLPVVVEHFENQPGWTVSHLFAPKWRLRRQPFGDLALGSMLHIIQDSFAAGHAERVYEGSSQCPYGRVHQFYSFVRQDSDKHEVEDLRPALESALESRFTSEANPISASARMISFARRKADWSEEVEPYLRNRLFCVEPGAEPSGPGPFA